MEDFEAFAIVQGKTLVDDALAAPKPEIDLSRDAAPERGAQALAKSQRQELFDDADDPEPVRRVT